MTSNTDDSNVYPYIHLKSFFLAPAVCCFQQCTKYLYLDVQQASQTQIQAHSFLRIHNQTYSFPYTLCLCHFTTIYPITTSRKLVILNCSLFLMSYILLHPPKQLRALSLLLQDLLPANISSGPCLLFSCYMVSLPPSYAPPINPLYHYQRNFPTHLNISLPG